MAENCDAKTIAADRESCKNGNICQNNRYVQQKTKSLMATFHVSRPRVVATPTKSTYKPYFIQGLVFSPQIHKFPMISRTHGNLGFSFWQTHNNECVYRNTLCIILMYEDTDATDSLPLLYIWEQGLNPSHNEGKG